MKTSKTSCLISWHKNCFQKNSKCLREKLTSKDNFCLSARNSTPSGRNDNQGILCKLDIITIKCMYFLFWKLEWYISFHTSCFLLYFIYVVDTDQISKLLIRPKNRCVYGVTYSKKLGWVTRIFFYFFLVISIFSIQRAYGTLSKLI